MKNLISSKPYRKDIDGLRAIAVIAVILFHFGFLPKGYLGVDVFFVISGYLITKIIYKESLENRFSIIDFYIRRIRRILPLVSLVCIVSLIIGMIVMLPDDLENLGQSIIATNFFSNNMLQYFTTHNYWDVVNEFKPLMHTWSLGIEEQYYVFHPFLFLIFTKDRIKMVLPILIIVSILSLVGYLYPFDSASKFYLLPFRFFELSIGGIGAIIFKEKIIKHNFSPLLIVSLIIIFAIKFSFLPANLELILTVLITLGLLLSANGTNKVSLFFLENKLMIFLGKISFSLYMWHQLVLAFSRYFLIKEVNYINSVWMGTIVVIMSIISYYFVEQVFRDKKIISKSALLWLVGISFILTTTLSFVIYLRSGVLKDIPELGIKQENIKRNMHAEYNSKIHDLDKEFLSGDEINVLVIGNSFARDWANVLLESNLKKSFNLSYIYTVFDNPSVKQRVKNADIIFVSTLRKSDLSFEKYGEDYSKIWCVGTKNFGISNGFYYNKKGSEYCNQRAEMEKGFFEQNNSLKTEWGEKYIDIIGLTIDENNTMPVFTPECRFISQDCRHFTKFGARYYAILLERKLNEIID